MRDKTIRVSTRLDKWLESNKGTKSKLAMTEDLAIALESQGVELIPKIKRKYPKVDLDLRITRKNKRGSVMDWFTIPIVMLILALVIIVSYIGFSNINTELQAQDSISAEGKSIMQDNKNAYVEIFDKSYLVVLVMLMMASMIGALMVDIHPIILTVSLPLLVVALLLSAVLGNTFYDISQTTEFASITSEFTVIPYVMTHLVEIMLFVIISISIAMFGKVRAWMGY